MKNLEQLSIADLKAVIELLRLGEVNADSRGDQFKYSIQRQELEDHLQKRLLNFGIEL